MTTSDILVDGFARATAVVHDTLQDLDETHISKQPVAKANSIGWLIWHLSRVQDAQIAEVAGREQVWTAAGWQETFALPYDALATGYGQTAEEVDRFKATSDQLLDYFVAVQEMTQAYLKDLSQADYDKIVDKNWDPPVTLGVRLVSTLADVLQHAGQAGYARGLLQ